MDLRFRFRDCFPARFSSEMTSLPLSCSSHSRRFPMSSVSFLDLRPSPAPPPKPPPPPPPEPLSPPPPPEPPDPPDAQICLFFGETLLQPPIPTSFRAFDSLLQLASARSYIPSPASLPFPPTKPLSSVVLLQVRSWLSNSSKMEMYWMFLEFVSLDLWVSDLVRPVSMGVYTLMSLCVLSCSAFIALMRAFTAVCRFCLNLALLESAFGEAYTHLLLLFRHLTGFHRAHHESEPPPLSLSRLSPPGQKPALPFIGSPSPRRTSCRRRLLLTPRIDIVCLKPSPLPKPRLLFTSRSGCSFFLSVIIVPLLFPQVCSYSSLSDSSTLGIYWMSIESVALTSWNPGLALAISMILDTLGSPFVLSCGTFIALVRNFTAVCRFYFELALLEVSLLQIVKRYLLSFTVPVNLVHRGSRSPHLSFKELIILPNTSLVFSGIVMGSIVVKIVLLGAEARIVVQDFSRSAIADSLTLEALFPLHLVEPMSSPLSLSLFLSIVIFFSLPSYSITLLIFVVGVLALCCLLVSSIDGG